MMLWTLWSFSRCNWITKRAKSWNEQFKNKENCTQFPFITWKSCQYINLHNYLDLSTKNSYILVQFEGIEFLRAILGVSSIEEWLICVGNLESRNRNNGGSPERVNRNQERIILTPIDSRTTLAGWAKRHKKGRGRFSGSSSQLRPW